MRFCVGELRFNATISDSATATSPTRDAALRRLTIQFRAQKPGMHAQALEAALLRRTGGIWCEDVREPRMTLSTSDVAAGACSATAAARA
jgi:hypothetical protein